MIGYMNFYLSAYTGEEIILVKVDLVKMEVLAKRMAVLDSDSNDTLGRLQQLNSEMSYDMKLLLFPNSQMLLQNMSDAVNGLRAADDMIHSLKRILSPLSAEYAELEEMRHEDMRRLAAKIGRVSENFHADAEGRDN